MNRPEISGKPEAGTLEEHGNPWSVRVHNDPVNLMDYVVMVFRKTLGMNPEEAKRHMLKIHREGSSVVWSGSREPAEHRLNELQIWHLKATLERSDDRD